MVDRVGIEPTDNCLQSSQEPQLNHSPKLVLDCLAAQPSKADGL